MQCHKPLARTCVSFVAAPAARGALRGADVAAPSAAFYGLGIAAAPDAAQAQFDPSPHGAKHRIGPNVLPSPQKKKTSLSYRCPNANENAHD
eukprot:3020532-Amphidinium_carterae.1